MATKIDNIPLTDIVLNRAWGGGGSNAKQLGGIPISFQYKFYCLFCLLFCRYTYFSREKTTLLCILQ